MAVKFWLSLHQKVGSLTPFPWDLGRLRTASTSRGGAEVRPCDIQKAVQLLPCP